MSSSKTRIFEVHSADFGDPLYGGGGSGLGGLFLPTTAAADAAGAGHSALFADHSTIAGIHRKCGGDAGLSSFAGSVSILISIVIMVTLIAAMHIG